MAASHSPKKMDDATTTNSEALVIDLTSSSDETKIRRPRMLWQIEDFNQAPPPLGSPGSDGEDSNRDSDEDDYDSGDEDVEDGEDGDDGDVVDGYNNNNNNSDDDDPRPPVNSDDDSDDNDDEDVEDNDHDIVVDSNNSYNYNSDDDDARPPAVAQVTPDFDGGCNQRRRRRASRADERKLRARPNHRSSPSTRHLAKRGNKRRRANGGERDGRTLRGAEEEDEDDGGGKDEGGGGANANINSYFEVDKILDRRINPRRGSETTGQAVEYCECVVYCSPTPFP